MYYLEEFGQRVKEIRRNLNFTQEEVYEKVHIHPKTIRNIEKGLSLPSICTLEILSNLYQVDLLKLLLDYRKVQFVQLDFYLTRITTALVHKDLSSLERIQQELTKKERAIEDLEIEKRVHLMVLLTSFHVNLLKEKRSSSELEKDILNIEKIIEKDLFENNLLYFLFTFLLVKYNFYAKNFKEAKKLLDHSYSALLDLDAPILPLYHCALSYNLLGEEEIATNILDLLIQKIINRKEMQEFLNLLRLREELEEKLYDKSFIQDKILTYLENL